MVSSDAALDLAERVIVVGLFGVFVYRMLGRFAALVALQIEHPELIVAAAAINLGAILLVLSESLGVFLIVLRRRSPTLSAHPLDWVLSFVAVNAPLADRAGCAQHVSAAGSRVGADVRRPDRSRFRRKRRLWRSFGVVPANRGIKTGGLYRFVRHPIYAGYAITHIGFLIGFPQRLEYACFISRLFLVQVARIAREERMLNARPGLPRLRGCACAIVWCREFFSRGPINIRGAYSKFQVDSSRRVHFGTITFCFGQNRLVLL